MRFRAVLRVGHVVERKDQHIDGMNQRSIFTCLASLVSFVSLLSLVTRCPLNPNKPLKLDHRLLPRDEPECCRRMLSPRKAACTLVAAWLCVRGACPGKVLPTACLPFTLYV